MMINTRNQVMSVRDLQRQRRRRGGAAGRGLPRGDTPDAPSIIVVHNHPSGDPAPSPDDRRVTEILVEAGKLLDIELLDHVVIGDHRFASLKSLNMWPK